MEGMIDILDERIKTVRLQKNRGCYFIYWSRSVSVRCIFSRFSAERCWGTSFCNWIRI